MRSFRSARFAASIGCTALTIFLLGGCGGGDGAAAADDDAPQASDPAPQQASAPGALDQQLAEQGEALFTSRACVGCHTIGGDRLVGPDLAGVTTRRERGWILAMILNPDSMIRNDEAARQLFVEYMTPMAAQNITSGEAAALYEFLRLQDEER